MRQPKASTPLANFAPALPASHPAPRFHLGRSHPLEDQPVTGYTGNGNQHTGLPWASCLELRDPHFLRRPRGGALAVKIVKSVAICSHLNHLESTYIIIYPHNARACQNMSNVCGGV